MMWLRKESLKWPSLTSNHWTYKKDHDLWRWKSTFWLRTGKKMWLV